MKVVKHKITGRLVHRTIPDFIDGEGIKNALAFYNYSEDELEEGICTDAEWEAELALREQESPRTLAEMYDMTYPNPQREAYKLSALHGLTHTQLDTYIDSNITNLAEAKEFMSKVAHVTLWLVKQTKLDE